MASLTDMWRAIDGKHHQRPYKWMKHEEPRNFIKSLANKVERACEDLCSTKRGGKHAGTFAHKQIAIAYAKYLSPEFHIFVNEVFMEKMEEEANPELSYEKNQSRADKAKEALVRKYQREGKLR